jgi:hypothetical protein
MHAYPGRLLRAPYTVVNDRFFFSVNHRICPYTTRRYSIVIRSHVSRRISPYTVVYDGACSTWVLKTTFILYFLLLIKDYNLSLFVQTKIVRQFD